MTARPSPTSSYDTGSPAGEEDAPERGTPVSPRPGEVVLANRVRRQECVDDCADITLITGFRHIAVGKHA